MPDGQPVIMEVAADDGEQVFGVVNFLHAFDGHLQIVAAFIAEIVGVDQRLRCRIGRRQPDRATALRPQHARVHGETIAGQAVAAVVVEQCGDKVELQIAARVLGVARAHETAAFGDVRRARAIALGQILEQHCQIVEAVVADGL